MTLSDLQNDTYFLTGTDSNSYSDSQLNSNLNRWYRAAVSWIWEASGTWEYDDSNKSTLPVATTDLGEDREDYTLPTGAQRIIEVEIKNSSGYWVDLEAIDKSQMGGAPSEFLDTPGTPRYYDVVANAVILYPAPDSAITGGLRVHVSREVDALSGDSDEPGFSESFHRILSYGAALDWCIAYGASSKEVDIRRQLFGDARISGLKEDLKEYYGRRNRDTKLRLNISKDNYN